MTEQYFFTSESVSEGHPDKICDQISDSILDAALKQDPNSRVAVETLTKDNTVVLAGEIRTDADIDYDSLVRGVIDGIGYNEKELGFDSENCKIINLIGKQSNDIAMGVDEDSDKNLGAGDQGLVFGFACNETESLMPLPIYYAHRLVEKQAQFRKSKQMPYLKPDAKSQVTFIYDTNNKPVGIDTVVLSSQHSESISQEELREQITKQIIYPVLKDYLIDNPKIYVNPTGQFIVGGPVGDCGLTGRKIIVDTYGGYSRHGGGAFSGKDPTKVDRSAAYMARYIAKNIVANDIADKCEIQISYAIGVSQPVSILVETFGTNKIAVKKIEQIVKSNFDLSPKGIIKHLDLKRPIYQQTASYGHFGRLNNLELNDFTWEKIQKFS